MYIASKHQAVHQPAASLQMLPLLPQKAADHVCLMTCSAGRRQPCRMANGQACLMTCSAGSRQPRGMGNMAQPGLLCLFGAQCHSENVTVLGCIAWDGAPFNKAPAHLCPAMVLCLGL